MKVVATFNYPKSLVTQANGVSNDGTIAGYFGDQELGAASFSRNASGTFSDAIIFPGNPKFFVNTYAYGINNAGRICGVITSPRDHGFFYDGTTFTQYDVPGHPDTVIFGENDAGDFVGSYGGGIAFANLAGVVTKIHIHGTFDAEATAINNLGEIVGAADGRVYGGFFRDAAGSITYPLEVPDAVTTYPTGINDQGTIVGIYYDDLQNPIAHGFILTLPDNFEAFDIPGGVDTNIGGINNSGLISGWYEVIGGHVHSFLAQLQ